MQPVRLLLMEILNNQFLFNAHGPNPYDIVISESDELSDEIQAEILLEADADYVNEIPVKDINNWLANRKTEWELEHGVPI